MQKMFVAAVAVTAILNLYMAIAIFRLESKIAILKKYRELLEDELQEVVPIAHTHGWKTHRHLEGKKLRKLLGEEK
jgi:hypothetical protein